MRYFDGIPDVTVQQGLETVLNDMREWVLVYCRAQSSAFDDSFQI